jgi:endoglycosylceramidase
MEMAGRLSSLCLVLLLLALAPAACGSASSDDDAQNAGDNDDDDNDDDDDDDDNNDDDDDETPLDRIPLIDDAGRELILHGANFMPIENNGQPLDYERMTDWGFNVVRIVITWRGLEPQQGVYDESYLPNVVEPQVQYAYGAGLRVVLNMHQYHWSPCCGGFGMPEWTCADLPDPPIEWLWQSGLFWDHAEYVDAFVAAWEKIAEHFAGDERIFAYDLFNEPIAGLRSLPLLMDDPILRPLYERLIAAVRGHDAGPWLWIEPSMATLLGLPFGMTPIDAERLVYSPHLYPGTIAEGGDYLFPKALIARQVRRRQNESLEQGAPLLIGETGLSSGVAHAEQYARDVADLLEAQMAHWTWWTFHYDDVGMGLCDASGQPKDVFYRHLARPFPQTTAGALRDYRFDEDARTLTVDFENREGLLPGVEIFLNAEYFYPEGFAVESSDADGAWSYAYDEAIGKLAIVCDPTEERHTISIVPASLSRRPSPKE